jgi:hypothetical protein
LTFFALTPGPDHFVVPANGRGEDTKAPGWRDFNAYRVFIRSITTGLKPIFKLHYIYCEIY